MGTMLAGRKSGAAEDDTDLLLAALGDAHEAMTAAVLAGAGLQGVAELAAEAIDAPVAIVIPGFAAALAGARAGLAIELESLEAFVAERLSGRPSAVPVEIVAETPIRLREELIGLTLLLRGQASLPDQAAELLRLAAAAALTHLAIEGAREEAERSFRGSLLEELRTREDLSGEQIRRRAARLGCDLSAGAVVLCVELGCDRPQLVLATIEAECPNALAEELESLEPDAARRIYAVLPASEGRPGPGSGRREGSQDAVLALAGRLARRLERYGRVGVSWFHADPAEICHAVREAELVLEVAEHCGATVGSGAGVPTYRLLFRMLGSHPRELHDFYRGTLGELIGYDEQNRTELLATLRAYLRANCNMNATAVALFTHRHTIAYRLERIRDLTGLDPAACEDRERLGLALKVHRLLAP